MAFNVAKIASARASLTISLTKSLRVAGPLDETSWKIERAGEHAWVRLNKIAIQDERGKSRHERKDNGADTLRGNS